MAKYIPAWFITLVSAFYLATRHTYLAGIPGLDVVAGVVLLFCFNWNLSTWLVNNIGQRRKSKERED